jgi:hypothetical protein
MAPMARRSLLLLLVLVSTGMVLAQTADAHCIKRHQVTIARGSSPTGYGWSVDGSIGNNGSCRTWLFGMEFNLEGAGYWGTSTGIPVGGHLDRRKDVSAFDSLLIDGSDRVFSGVVSGDVAKVLVTLSDNKHLVIHPKRPRPELRRKVVWLRNVKYFVDYYRPTGFVTQFAAFSRTGRLLRRDKHFEGL